MIDNKQELINYRILRTKATLEDAILLFENDKWNSCVNRLYYAIYYPIMALLIKKDLTPTTHNGVKSNFNIYFIKSKIIDKEYGRLFSQLFNWRHKGDYDDLFDFDNEKVEPLINPVKEFIALIEELIYSKK